jgi:hypothetical protein
VDVTQDALAALRDSHALAQTLTFEQLEAYHVPFDQLAGTHAVERELGYWSTRAGRVALIGDSGAGKSSVMAAVLGAFSQTVPERLVPVRIPVELAGPEAITTVPGFGRHVVRHILNWAAPEAFTPGERAGLERQIAETERKLARRRRAGFSLGTGRLLPVDAGLSGDLTGAATDIERELGGGDVLVALKRLIAMFRARGLEPFLIFDDTDAWLQLPGQEKEARKLASAFFATNVRMMTRELDCGFVLAIHRSYLGLPAYQQLADSLEVIDLPIFPNAVEAITVILQRRLDVEELRTQVRDAFDGAALEALADIYDDVPDLRRVMAVAALAVRKAHDSRDANIVTRQAIHVARAQRDTVRGRRA